MNSRSSYILQGLLVAVVIAVIAGMAITANDNLLRQGVRPSFRFLLDRTGWDVASSPLSQAPDDPYWWTFLVGLVNTVLLSLLCIVLATIGGSLLALLSTGRSRIPYVLARAYVWTFRNVPLIVQLFFWYAVTRQLPPVRQAIKLLSCCYASNRGLYIPRVSADFNALGVSIGIAAALAGTIAIALWNRKQRDDGNDGIPATIHGTLVAALFFVVLLSTSHLELTQPRLQGFNYVDGVSLSPEFVALAAAIVTYNIAFIAEILASGIRSVPRNQLEAARVIGLSDQRTFWTITVPQAIRTAVPPLISQYISLTKSSSLAIAIGYTDLFAVGVIAINHTGQSINVIAVLMLMYLCMSFGISALGNIYNRSVAKRSSW